MESNPAFLSRMWYLSSGQLNFQDRGSLAMVRCVRREAAGQTGSNVGSAANAAATGAMEAASTLSQSAIVAVRDVLVTAVGGVKDVVGAMWPKGEATSETEAETPEKKGPKK